MTFIPTPNAARVSIVAAMETRELVNTLWFLHTSPFTLSDLQDLLTDMEFVWVTNVLPLLSPSYEVTSYVAWAQDSNTAPRASSTPGSSHVGTHATGNNMPMNLAACVSFYTAARGRSGRGRNFVGGVSSDQLLDVRHFTTTFISDLTTAYATIGSGMASNGHTHVVVSHFHDKVALSAGVARPVVAYVVNARIDTQRHRLGRS